MAVCSSQTSWGREPSLSVRVPTGPAGTAGVQANTVATSETTTSLVYTDLATPGPSVTVTIPAGTTRALVIVTAEEKTSNGSNSAFISFAVSGASTVGATDARAFEVQVNNFIRASATSVITGLTPGINTFTAKYRVSGATGTFAVRDITVIPLP